MNDPDTRRSFAGSTATTLPSTRTDSGLTTFPNPPMLPNRPHTCRDSACLTQPQDDDGPDARRAFAGSTATTLPTPSMLPNRPHTCRDSACLTQPHDDDCPDARRAFAGSTATTLPSTCTGSDLTTLQNPPMLPNRPHTCRESACLPQPPNALQDDDGPPSYAPRVTPHQQRILEDLKRPLMIHGDDPLVSRLRFYNNLSFINSHTVSDHFHRGRA
jgi:hypothetical protein